MKFDLFHQDILDNPQHYYSELHATGANMLLGSPPMPEFPECWYVIGYNAALQVLRSPAFVHDRGKVSGLPPLAEFSGDALRFWKQLTEWPLFLDAPEHTATRQLFGSYFKEASILELSGFIRQKSDDLLDQALTKPSFDLMQDFAFPLSLGVICHLTGIKTPELSWFKSCTQRLADTMDLRRGSHDYQPSLLAIDELNDFFRYQIRKTATSQGLLGYMLEKDICEEELLPLLLQIIFAGQETTADAIGISVMTLAKHQNQRAQLIDSPQLTESAIREILRYSNSLQFSGIRTATEAIEIGGIEIARGDSVLIALGACNHDPSYFSTPEFLDFNRSNFGPELSFGHGIHYCLGVHLARLEMQIALNTLLRKLPKKWQIGSFDMRQNRLFRGPRSLTISLN